MRAGEEQLKCGVAGSGHIAAIILAAGSSRRMGGANKLLMECHGEIATRRVASAALDAGVDDVIVVVATGDCAVVDSLRGLRVRIVENSRHAEGIASSIRTGIAAVAPTCGGALIMLADMPLVAAPHLLPMLQAFATATPDGIVVPDFRGRRGNPVLWGRRHFSDLMALTGDVGARDLVERRAACVIRVDAADDAVLVDFDTPQDWARLRTRAS